MDLLIVILLFVLGLVLIVKGGDFFVDAATWIAEVSGMPKFLIGATVVSLATTLPEMIVSIMASLEGKALIANPATSAEGLQMVGMGIGNAVGSVTANTALIMGIAIMCLPFAFNRKQYTGKISMLLIAAAALPLFCMTGKFTFIGAIALLIISVVFIIENIRSAKSQKAQPDEAVIITKKIVAVNIIKFVAGAAGIIIGARLLVDNGSELARYLKIPESIIGLTVIAIGTSLPELVTMIISVRKKQVALSVGNIIGANIIDLTTILPICAIVSGGAIPVVKQSYMLDMPICLLVAAIMLVPALIKGQFRRWQGITTIAIYVIYILFVSFYPVATLFA